MIIINNTAFDDRIPHWHNPKMHVPYHIFILVVEGSLYYELNQSRIHAFKGDWVFVPAGTLREAYNDETGPHQKYTVTFQTNSDLGLPMLNQRKAIMMQSRSFEFLRERFIWLYRHAINREPYFEAICSGILLEMLGNANRELEKQRYPARKVHHVHLLEQYIQEHYRQRITLQQLADHIQRSPNYTLTIFKEITGHTPTQYQHRLRITSSMEMLQTTRLTISAIAEHLGYYDASSFYKMFRKITGMSPTSYVRQHV